jgi:hypothetical protein
MHSLYQTSRINTCIMFANKPYPCESTNFQGDACTQEVVRACDNVDNGGDGGVGGSGTESEYMYGVATLVAASA